MSTVPDQVLAYTNILINALSAAAQTYLLSPNAVDRDLVNTIVEDLQTARVAISGVTTPDDARGIALQIVALARQLLPILAPVLGTAGMFVPLAIGVIEAFINALPHPAGTPPEPPAVLHALAQQYDPAKRGV